VRTEEIHLKRVSRRRGVTVYTGGFVSRRLTQAGCVVFVFENTLMNLGVMGAARFLPKWRNRFSEGDVRIFVYKLGFKLFK
jgi:hypothetical protein